MGSIYGIVIPKRLKNALKSGNWIYALGKFRNKSDTLNDLRNRTKVALDEFILLTEKMPRSELPTALPPEKVVKLVSSYLNEDPEEERLRLAVFEQSERLKRIQNLEEIREIMKKREIVFRQRVDAIGRKRNVSSEEQAAIKIQVEREVWSEEDVLELQWLAREQVDYWHLEGQYANHSKSVDAVRTKLAGDLALVGITYCSDQIGKVIEDVMAKRVRESLADASELVTFIPAKVASDSSNMKK